MKAANFTKQMAADIRELVRACESRERVEAQNQTTLSKHGDTTWYRVVNAKVIHATVYVQGVDGKWFMLREYRLVTEPLTETIVCKNPLTYEEILNWTGFSFETSRQRGMWADDAARDGEYGIAEANRIMNNVVNKQK